MKQILNFSILLNNNFSYKLNHLFFVNLVIILSSCSHFIETADRPEIEKKGQLDGVYRYEPLAQNEKGEIKLNENLYIYAYELGLNPDKPLTQQEYKEVLNRKKVRDLEKKLDSPKERLNYSKVIHLLKSDEEKIEYLTIPSPEGRQAWVNRNKIWARQTIDPDLVEIAQKLDIAVGMTPQLVKQAWGDPHAIEPSGNPIYKNERWKYIREVPTQSGYKRERRYIYFQGGKVVGWETE